MSLFVIMVVISASRYGTKLAVRRALSERFGGTITVKYCSSDSAASRAAEAKKIYSIVPEEGTFILAPFPNYHYTITFYTSSETVTSTGAVTPFGVIRQETLEPYTPPICKQSGNSAS